MVTRATLQLHHGECMSSFNCHDSSMIIHHDHDHFYYVNMNINMNMIIINIFCGALTPQALNMYLNIYLSIYSVCVSVFPCIPLLLFVDNLPIHSLNNRYHYHIY